MEKLDRYKAIWRLVQKFGYNYDYREVYINSQKDICRIGCEKHGFFEVKYEKVLQNKTACSKCSIDARKLTWEKFILKAQEKYGDRIEFIKPNDNNFYPTFKTKIKCKCNTCGNIMFETVGNILCGRKRLKCCEAYKKTYCSEEDVIKRIKEKLQNDNLDFSKFVYKGMHTKCTVICKLHGAFEATPNNLLLGKGCKQCGIEKRAEKMKKSHHQYVSDCEKVHGTGSFIYLTKYNGYSNPITYKCTKCGKNTTTIAGKHLEGVGCHFCHLTHLEREITVFLTDLQIGFINNFRIGRKHLDFFLPNFNVGIECQGIQHFEHVSFFNNDKTGTNSLDNNIKRDIEKYNYCKEHKIKLLYFFNIKDDFESKIYNEKFKNIYQKGVNVFSDKLLLLENILDNNELKK